MNTSLHIVARKLFTDLSIRLRKEDFDFAGHSVIGIIFADKCKAQESRPIQHINIGDECGRSIRKGIPSAVVVSDRMQASNTVAISPVYFDKFSNFDGLFKLISDAAPNHFNADSPVPIKTLMTRHNKTNATCVWKKVKIQVAPDRDEWRLLLYTINDSTEFDLELAEEVADGMIETVCETTEQATHVRNVCNMIASRKY